MVVRGDSTLGGEYTAQYIDHVSQNCVLETYTILLTKATPVNLIKLK